MNKVDGTTNQPISGASFLLHTNQGQDITLTPTGMMTSSTPFQPGTSIVVTETQAPTGYVRLIGQAEIHIPQNNQDLTVDLGGDFNGNVEWEVKPKAKIVQLTVKNSHPGILPSTGGTGPLKPFLLSALLAAVAMMLLGVAWLQHKREGEDL